MEQRREQILDAAERRIRAAGYNGFSFREIAAEIGIKSASVHHHFATKEALAATAARRYTERFYDGLSRLPGTPVERLSRAFRSAMESDGLMCLCGVLGAESGSLPVPVAAEAKQFFEQGLLYLTGARASAARRDWALQVLSQLEGAMVVARALGDVACFARATRRLPPGPSARVRPNRLRR